MSPDRDNLEEWLTEHPEVKEDLDDLPRLRELYQSAPPPQPIESTWNTVRSRLHDSLGRNQSRRRVSPRLRWSILGLTAAAAAVLALFLTRSWWTTQAPPPPPQIVEPFPVAEADDIAIISMDARDVAALVVGEPPVWGDLEFARPEDIRVIRCERCPHSGRFARLEPGDEVPMLVTAFDPANDD
ncbi:MAG: hypothetical protein ACYC3I_07045 [Gemmataceae bacterium]